MKRLSLVLLVALLLVGCGGRPAASAPTSSPVRGATAAPAAPAPTAAPAAPAPTETPVAEATTAPGAGAPEATETPLKLPSIAPILTTRIPDVTDTPSPGVTDTPLAEPSPVAPVIATGTPSVDEIANREYHELKDGKLAFNPPKEMRLGDVTTVQLRISRKTIESGTVLATDIPLSPGMGSETIIAKNIKVNTVMEAVLVGDKFRITPKSSEEQVVLVGSSTEWSWFVEPLEEGIHTLTLRITVKININDIERAMDFLVDEENVQVNVSGWSKISAFFENNWDKILGFLVPGGMLGIVAWLYQRWKNKRKPNRA